MIVTRYGVHWASGGVAFLHQGKTVQHVLPIPDLHSPFELRTNVRCPHAIDLSNTAPTPPEIADDPLFRVMLPLPYNPAGPRASMIVGVADRILEPLKALSAPLDQIEHAIWMEPAKEKRKRFLATNIGPLVFNVPSVEYVDRMEKVMEFAAISERRVLFVDVSLRPIPTPKGVERIETKLTPDIAALPLTAIGSGALRHYMLTKELPI